MPAQPVPALEEARRNGVKYYNTGKPCVRGHLSDRLTNGGQCLECIRQVGREKYHAASAQEREARKLRSARSTLNNPAGRMIVRAKVNARKRGVPFNLTVADILPLPTHCPVLGILLSNNHGIENRASSYSLDRIVPSLGYVRGNVIVMSYRANVIKHDATIEELESLLTFLKSQS